MSTRATVPAGTSIPSHGHYLIIDTATSGGPYSGSVAGNLTFTTGITDDGGIALLNASNVIIDQVGMSAGSAYKEGTTLASLGSTNANRCYERKPGGSSGSTQDTDVNSADFQLISPCDPQNLASAPTPGGTNPGALQFSAATYSVNENGATATINVTRTGGSDGAVSVNYATSNGTATAGSDYAATSGTISFAAGDSATKSFTVAISDDSSAEGNETVNLTLSGPTGGATLGAQATAVLTIVDNDNAGALQFSSATYTVAENGGSATINVTRAGGSDGAVSVNYATGGGTAAAGTDYTPVSGTLSFANGELSKSFSVPVIDDAVLEGNKTVNVTLSNPAGGAILGSPTTAVLTITENETVPAGAVVISQIYGGGGNSGAAYKNDFVEIFNRSSQSVDLSNWSVQYTSAAGPSGPTWSGKTLLSGVIAPGQYLLVSGASNGSTGATLPAADIVGAIDMSASNGKVALVNSTASLTSSCPVGGTTVIDFVGYGSANCFEGPSAAPALDAGTAALRARNGCKDTDYNGINFTEVAPTPRNSSSPTNICPVGDEAPEVFTTTPASGDNNIALASNVTINFDQLVNVSGSWFEISCATSGVHTAAVSGNGASFTLNPDVDFAGNETCTVKVFASQVTDQDANDPPDMMVADYTFSFHTLVVRDPSEHMVMGNPSGAVTDEATPLNYLMMKPQFALSYNNDRGIPNWTSWHLDSSWTTNVSDRTNAFRPDDTLPASFKHVQSGFNAATYGFDRGHMTPSADRTSSIEDNRATFLMTNMIPQASGNNQGPWNNMEQDIRGLLNGSNNEIYIVSGGYGTGGNSTTGHWDSIQDTGGNTVAVPAFTWKVVMVMPRADGDDVARVNTETRTFAVIMPNNDNIRPDDWRKYLATVDQVEALTGYNFFSNVPDEIENVIEARLDGQLDTAPTASGQNVSTAEDTQKAVTLSVTDFNVNNVLTYTVVRAPQHGTLSEVSGNQVTYTPDLNYNGPDSFTFKANDGAQDSNVATVNINVVAVNDAPVANDDAFTTDEDTPVTSNVLANDTDVENDALSVTIVGPASHGTAEPVSGGDIKYTPNANYNGTDSFTYTVSDGHGGTAHGTVNVTVNSVNDGPVAADDSAATDEDTAVVIDVLANDSDADGGTLSVSEFGNGSKGTAQAAPGGKVRYTPNANANGPDSFTYTVSDGQGGTATATVNVQIKPVNDAPTLSDVPASANVPEQTLYTFDASADDVDGQALTFSLVGAPAGAAIDPSTGVFTWTPSEAQGGTGSPYGFAVRVSDGTASVDSPVSITVSEVNSKPSLAPIGSTTVAFGSTLAFTANGSDSDVPAQTLTYSLTGNVPAGATINPSTGAFSWTPTPAQVGQGHSFNVRVTDDGAGNLFAEQPVSVNVAYTMTNVLAPVKADGSSVFKAGQTIPVKFQLTGASAAIADASIVLLVAKVSNNVIGTEMEAASTSNATEGNLFRYSDGQYIFNLSTKDLTPGTYQLRIDAGDGVQHTVLVSLR